MTNNDLQNIALKTKDRVTETSRKTESELRCSGRVGSDCSTSGTRRVTLVTNPVTNHEWGKGRNVLTTSGTYPWSSVTHIFRNGQPSHDGDRKIFKVMQVNISISIMIKYISKYSGKKMIKKERQKLPHCPNNSKFQ